MRPLVRRTAWTTAAVLVAATSAWALQRTIRTTIHNHPTAPLVVTRSATTLVETYAAPTQMWLPAAKLKRSRVRYANRAGLAPSTYVLTGDVVCRNAATQSVQAVEVTVVLLDAFHQPIHPAGQAEDAIVRQVVVDVPRQSETTIAWEQPLGLSEAEIFEVAVVITGVRFADGTIWTAPDEELIDMF